MWVDSCLGKERNHILAQEYLKIGKPLRSLERTNVLQVWRQLSIPLKPGSVSGLFISSTQDSTDRQIDQKNVLVGGWKNFFHFTKQIRWIKKSLHLRQIGRMSFLPKPNNN